EMGIAVAANPRVEIWDPMLRQTFENGSGFEAQIRSEGGRFNINYVLMSEDKVLLRQIFDHWGIDLDVASEITDALMDWVDSDDDIQLNGAEVDWYEGQGFGVNRPFNRPFYDLDEMRLVRGMDIVEAANPRWRNWFTVWSSGGLDINEAPAEFLAVAADGNIEEAISLVEIIDGADGIRRTEDDQTMQAQAAMELLGMSPDEVAQFGARFNGGTEQVTRIESIGFSGSVRRKIVLIIQNRSNGRPTILDRREELIQ
ncbi:general secretion pathway protein GspK, partial [Akkermansiaceae bacterium]|nr:general secretion pathway protein GspK [Akkermansiaceae bacterium]